MWICEKSQSGPAITGVENKAFVIAEQPKFKFVRYSGMRLAGDALKSARYNKVSVVTGSVIVRSDCIVYTVAPFTLGR